MRIESKTLNKMLDRLVNGYVGGWCMKVFEGVGDWKLSLVILSFVDGDNLVTVMFPRLRKIVPRG